MHMVTLHSLPNETRVASCARPITQRAHSHAHACAYCLLAAPAAHPLGRWTHATPLEQAFASKAVFVEMRLRQALQSSAALGAPNAFGLAVVCDAFERIAPFTGRFEGVLVLIWREIVRELARTCMRSPAPRAATP